MKSKKILVPVILAALVLIAVGIGIFNKNSNTETTEKETATSDSADSSSNDTEDTSNTDSTSTEDSSNTNTTEKNASTSNNSENTEPNNNTVTNNGSDSNKAENGTNDNSNASNSSTSINTIFTEKDAADILLAYLLGNEDLDPNNLTPVELATGTNVATKKEGSNTFYFKSGPFKEGATDGIIIVISNYNSANKTYEYEIKDYADLLEGQDVALDKGTVANNGEVVSK